MQVEDTQTVTRSSSVSEAGVVTVGESAVYDERPVSKGEYGSRTDPIDSVYGYAGRGDLVIALA